MEWQQDGEDGLTGAAFEFDEAVVTAHEILRDGETESGAVRTTCDQRIEQRVAQLLWHAGTVVLELHARDESVATRADVHVRQRSRTQRDP